MYEAPIAIIAILVIFGIFSYIRLRQTTKDLENFCNFIGENVDDEYL